jgi:hypothetical protein
MMMRRECSRFYVAVASLGYYLARAYQPDANRSLQQPSVHGLDLLKQSLCKVLRED